MSDPADQQRLIGDLIRLGTVDSVDLAAATCRIKTGDLITGDLPWLTLRAGGTRHWSPLTVGEQCVLICPEGDTLGGLVLPGLFSDANAAPSSEDLDLVEFADGARISYDATAHALKAVLPDGATAEVTAPGGLTITADVTIMGKLSVSETIDADDEITGKGIKLSAHHHKDTQPGAGMTGDPL
jgi:phage baseplate assembly protein V